MSPRVRGDARASQDPRARTERASRRSPPGPHHQPAREPQRLQRPYTGKGLSVVARRGRDRALSQALSDSRYV